MISSSSNLFPVKPLAKFTKYLAFSLLLGISLSNGQKVGELFPTSDVFSWSGCEDIKPSDFVQVKLVTFKDHGLKQPSEVAFVKTSDVPNFYYLEKITGRVMYYVDDTKAAQVVGVVEELNVKNASKKVWEDGLNGIALDYDFEKTRWMYLWYSIDKFFRIARFKISAANKMDYSSQQVLLEIPKQDRQWHASGSMDFDVYGDLWIAVGDNLYGYYNDNHYVSMATANLLGSWLRIHPTEEKQPNGKYYTIPKDNFGEYWAKKFEAQGKADLAQQYRDPKVVFPEIFAKGIRNSWGLKVVEPFRRFVASGECGPDHPKPSDFTEETNIANTPKFFGWPIQAGATPTLPFKGRHLASLPGGTKYDKEAPEIGSNTKIKGAKVLPPIQDAVYHWGYRRPSCGTGAAMYWYDGYSKSKRKFPPHLNGKLFATDHDKQWIRIVTLNDAMDKTLSESQFFSKNGQINTEKPLDITFGPDGALYVIHWVGDWFTNNTKQNISRIEYKGSCHPEEPKSPFRGCMVPTASNYDPRVKYGCPNNACCSTVGVKKPDIDKIMHIGQQQGTLNISIHEKGSHSLQVFNVSGKLIASGADKQARQYSFSNLQRGLYLIEVEMGKWKFSRKALVNF